MAKVKDILSSNELEILKLTKTDDEIVAIAKQRHKEHQDLQQTIQQQNETKPTVKEALKDSIYADDGIGGDIARGVTSSGIRMVNFADGVANAVGFDLVPDKYTKVGNDVLNEFEDIKQTTSRKDLSTERLTELKKLDEQSQNAQTPWENIKAGVNTMVDTVSHPLEWTGQGVVEMISDPLNAVSFGAGSLAGKLGRTMIQKGVIGGGAGITEGAVVNSGAEYIIAKGQNKSDEEAKKIALQSAGGGAIAGGVFGTFGGIVSNTTAKIPLEKTVTSDILNNELLKLNDNKPLSDEQIGAKLQEAFNNYPKVDEEFKKETAGVNKYSVHPQDKGEQNFQLVYDNLPVVRASKEIVPLKLKELVDVELIDPIQAQQIEQKINKMITHKDIIYANYDGWAENISQDILDSINTKKMIDMKKTQDISTVAHNKSKDITAELVEQGADINTIKDTINKEIIPTKEEKAMIKIVNDGMPVENRMSGFRMRDMVLNTFDVANGRADELKAILKRGGIVDEFSNVIIESILNKDINVYDDYVVNKIGAKSEAETKALKQIIVKDLKDANKNTDKTTAGEDVLNTTTTTDNPNNPNDTKSTGTTDISETTRRDAGTNNSDATVSNETKPMDGQPTTTDNERVVSQFDRDEVVQPQTTEGGFQSIKDNFEKDITQPKIIPDKHEGVGILSLTDEQREQRREYNKVKSDLTHQIYTNGKELKDMNLDEHSLKIAQEIWDNKLKEEDTKNRYVNYDVIKDIDKDISYEEAYQAHSGTSFSPERRAKTEIESHIETLTDDYETLLKYADNEEKKAVLDTEFVRYRAGLTKRNKDLLSRKSRTYSSMISGPANFPVARMNKLNGYVDNALNEYINYREKVLRAIKNKLTDSGIIKSDDVDAIGKLEKKLDVLVKNQETMKEANKIMRSKVSSDEKTQQLKALGLSDKIIKEDIAPHGKFPSFKLTNNNQTISNTRKRIKQLKSIEEQTSTGEISKIEYVGGEVVDNFEAKRVQIFFDDIPNVEVRTELKKNGFKWSPTNRAWQRMLNNDGKYKASFVMDKFFAKKQADDIGAKFDDKIIEKYTKDSVDNKSKFETVLEKLEEC